jgi:hypothetical protein
MKNLLLPIGAFVLCCSQGFAMGNDANTGALEPRLWLESTAIDLGKIAVGQDKIEGVIRFMNEGDAVLAVSKITGSCDCFLGIEGDKVLSPGHGGELLVRFDKEKIESGPVKRMVRFETNDPANSVVRVTFSFEIERTDSEEIRWLRKDLAEVKQQLALLRADMRLEPGSILQRCAEGMFEERTVKVYKDHLARDYENFLTGGPCAGPNGWKVTTFNVNPQPTMSNWNCHGSTQHHYNGSGSGWVGAPDLLSLVSGATVKIEVPVTHYPSGGGSHPPLGALNRGDIVAYLGANGELMHSQTCMGIGTDTYGANNEPLAFPGYPGVSESWKWALSPAGDWTNDQWLQGTPLAGFEPVIVRVYAKPTP